MNFLAGDIASSDSSDGDYVPPPDEPARASGALSIRKRPAGGLELQSDDDHSDMDSDLDDGPAVAAQAAALLAGAGPPPQRSRRAAGSSSAGAGPSSAGPSASGLPAAPPAPSDARPAGRPAELVGGHRVRPGGSAAGPIASDKNPGHLQDQVRISHNQQALAGATASPPPQAGPPDGSVGRKQAGASANSPPAATAGAAGVVIAHAQPARACDGRSGSGTGAPPVIPVASSSAASSSAAAASAAGSSAAGASAAAKNGPAPSDPAKLNVLSENDTLAIAAENVAPALGEENGEQAPPTKKPRVDSSDAPSKPSENKTQSIDEIWAEMNASSAPKRSAKPAAAANDPGLMSWLAQSQPRQDKAKPFKLKRLGDLENEVKEEKQRAEAEAEAAREETAKPKRRTGLEGILEAVRGPKKDGVLDKTREKWQDFKGKDEEVETELESYKKDKNRYTDKVAFLERTDVREWEYEQSGKRRRR